MSKSKSKRGKKARRAVVRGPQAVLSLGRAKGEPPRTARVRYVEPPAKKKGSPFVAVRVPGEMLRAFRAHAKKKGTDINAMVRAYISKVTGVSEVNEDGE